MGDYSWANIKNADGTLVKTIRVTAEDWQKYALELDAALDQSRDSEIHLLPDEETGTWCILYPDLPGCISQGNTLVEALAHGKDAKQLWLESMKEQGMEIPKRSEFGVAHELHEAKKRIKELEAENAKLREGLREIAEHPHCEWSTYNPTPKYFKPYADGHRCAAAIAKKLLEEE